MARFAAVIDFLSGAVFIERLLKALSEAEGISSPSSDDVRVRGFEGLNFEVALLRSATGFSRCAFLPP